MKKLFILFSLALCLSLFGCSTNVNPDVEENKSTESELTTDVLVIGGGGSGMVSAINLAENGIDTLLVEKNAFLGGATMLAGGGMIVTGSKIQEELGVTNDSPELLMKELKAGANNTNDEKMLNLYAYNLGPTVDWLMDDVGIQFVDVISQNAEYSVPRGLQVVDNAAGLNSTLKSKLDSTSARVLTSTKVDHLIQDESGKIIGAEATNEVGEKVTIKANSVILATGGFGANKELLPAELQKTLYYGPDWSMGDGLIMAQEVGAATKNLTYGKTYPNGLDVDGKAVSTVYGSMYAPKLGSPVLVNLEGSRVVNEAAGFPEITAVLKQQETETLYMVMDEATHEIFAAKNAEHDISLDKVQSWLDNNGANEPIYIHAETLEEAANTVGIDAEQLKASIDAYNAALGSVDEFGRTISIPFDTESSVYIVEQKPRFATTLGGIVINEQTQVLDVDGNWIEGLYACGEVVCGPQGNDSLPGTNIGWAMTSGKLVSDFIINNH